MKESDVVLEVKHSIDKQLRDVHYKKIPDQIFNPNSRFNPEKDYDSYCCYKGCFTALEYKIHKKKSAFPLDKVTLIQRSALLEASDSGGNAYVVICVRYEQVRKLFFIPIKYFIIFCQSADRKSMPVDSMDKYYQAKWAGKGIWSLDEQWFLY